MERRLVMPFRSLSKKYVLLLTAGLVLSRRKSRKSHSDRKGVAIVFHCLSQSINQREEERERERGRQKDRKIER